MEIWLATHSERSEEPCSTSGFEESTKAFISQEKSNEFGAGQTGIMIPRCNLGLKLKENVYYVFFSSLVQER